MKKLIIKSEERMSNNQKNNHEVLDDATATERKAKLESGKSRLIRISAFLMLLGFIGIFVNADLPKESVASLWSMTVLGCVMGVFVLLFLYASWRLYQLESKYGNAWSYKALDENEIRSLAAMLEQYPLLQKNTLMPPLWGVRFGLEIKKHAEDVVGNDESVHVSQRKVIEIFGGESKL
jgi:hypothetical protein